MSVCGQSGQTEEDSGSEEVTATAAAVRDIYKQKPVSKVVRVLTVLAYLLSVSLAAILLSVYYVCVWRSPELPRLNDTGDGGGPDGGGGLAALRDPHPPGYHRHVHTHSALPRNDTGGGDSGVNASELPTTNVTESSTPVTVESTTDLYQESTTDTFSPESLNSTFGSGTNDTDVT